MNKDFIELTSGASRARISPHGAEWLAWSVDGRELLWAPDGVHWDRTAPVLFPVCGWTRGGVARVAGETFPLGLHGFAIGERFEVVGQGADHVTLRLTQSAATLAQYPFPFTLEVTYRLDDSSMEVAALIRNPGDAPMPYAFGLHPGFRWPLAGGDKAAHRLVFDAPERAEVPVIAPGGLFSQQMRPVPVEGRKLLLDEALFAREALCFLGAASEGLSFEGPEGRLRMDWEGFPHLVVWSRPGAPFLCLETWTGHGDPEGFEGDLFDKPSMITLPPGGEGRHRVRYAFL